MKQIKPCVDNDVLKTGVGDLITENTVFTANDEFTKRGTTIRLLPSSQKGNNIFTGMINNLTLLKFLN